MEQLLSCDTYEVKSDSIFLNERLPILTLLDQPLIGVEAMSLYLYTL